jgi:hypothetical protein
MNPQEIFRNRKFKRVVLDPPNFNPGSWRGAGKLLLEEDEYWLTSRPRTVETRGYGVEVFHSNNGEDFHLVSLVTKEEIAATAEIKVFSIENNQLIRDPSTGKYHLYASLNVGAERPERWETYLLTADDPRGPWRGEGFVIRTDRPYDSEEARDCTVDVLDGRYLGLCKARAQGSEKIYTELLTSRDGRNWVKLGIPTVDGRQQDPRSGLPPERRHPPLSLRSHVGGYGDHFLQERARN